MQRLIVTSKPIRALLQATDWSSTPLGCAEGWPPELWSAIRTVLPAQLPMLVLWGPELSQIYNEAFASMLGDNRPPHLGRPAAESFAGIWHEVGPLLESVLAGNGAVYAKDLMLFLASRGDVEETYWTSSYSPIHDDAGVVRGIFVATVNTTPRVLNDRRFRTLHALGTLSSSEAGTAEDACRSAVAVLEKERADVPFALGYLVDAEGHRLTLTACCGVRPGSAIAPNTIPATRANGGPWFLDSDGSARVVTDLRDGDFALGQPGGDARAPSAAMVLPLTAGPDRELGLLVLGVSPYRILDDDYRTFFELVAGQVSTALTDALAYETERRRAESLGEIHRAKTQLFENISHEFRTPLTLALVPTQTLLASSDVDLPQPHRDDMQAAHRAMLRLRRLVDALLDVTRVGTGVPQPRAEPTDLAALTADCASMFRSAIENVGMQLVVDTPELPAPVDVDRDMWTKIVLNLLSNAVKFTHKGTISVRLRALTEHVELTVTDTGIGVPRSELTRIFDRFQRVSNTSAPSCEGAGIGLALVAELVEIHHGDVRADSTLGRGSTFTVVIPRRAARPLSVRPLELPRVPEQALVFEGPPEHHGSADPGPAHTSVIGAERRLLLVEDDADMRGYLRRLLLRDGWIVDAVRDVETALSRTRPPDLLLSDIMLPGRDGLDLLRVLRAHSAFSRVPVILLTARASSESAARGLADGADDYVVKPFDPGELLARVRVHFELSQLREFALREAEGRATNLRIALTSNREIGTAIGILMNQDKITADDAFDLLRRSSQNLNRKLRDIADELISTGLLPR